MERVPSSSQPHASDVFAEWQRFIGGVTSDVAIRPIILDSWRRSGAAGVEPEPARITARRVTSEELERRRIVCSELIELARPHLDWLSSAHASIPHVAYLVDRDGIVLHATGMDDDALDAAGLLPGYDRSEAAIGTSGAGTALIAGVAVTVAGPEHFTRPLHGYTCSGAPVRGPAGEIVGAIDLSTDVRHATTDRLLVVAQAAYAIAQALRHRDSARRSSGQLEVERRLAEERAQRLAILEALRESEARYHHIAANVPGVVYRFVYWPDGTKGYTFVSEGARTLFGVAPEDALRDPQALLDLIPLDEYPEFQAAARAAAAVLGQFRWEGRLVLPSGEERFVYIAARDHRQPDGGVASDGLVMDVTELRRATQQREESEQRYRSLFEHHPDAVYSIGTDGRFLSANPACETISGYAPEELIGREFAPFIMPEHLELALEHFNAAVAGSARRYEVAIRHKTGHRVELDVTNIPMMASGEVVGIFGIARDLTVRRALEAQLRQAQKMEAVGRLAGGVAHDFNNILAAITGFAELLRDDIGVDDPRHTDVEEILKGARRATALTRQLLAFSRKQVLQPEVLDLNEIIAETATLLRPLLGGVHLVALPAPQAVPVFADQTQIEQVLMNLALNARDAMPNGGTLTIELTIAPADAGASPAATLIVSDTGVGMSPEVEARAFEPFFTTKPPGQGTGLGLSTVHGIVQQSGGTIRVATREGEGTTFIITLPLVQSATDAETPAPDTELDRGAGTVLLVEDEEAVRAIARRVLERAGYRVLIARHGADAISVLAERGATVDVLLTDVVMPEMGGLELAVKAAERLPELPVILMSGYAHNDVDAIGADVLIAGFVTKPFTTESLLKAIREVVPST